MKSIKEANLKDKKVLLRVGFDVPLDAGNEILDDTRIKISLPTLKFLLNSGAKKIILITHLGRPVMRAKENIPIILAGNKNLSVQPVVKNLAGWLKIKKDQFDLVWDENYPLPYYEITDKLIIMENIRFLDGETKNDLNLNKNLAALADIYINDAFSDSHRAHSSIYGVAKLLPSYAGLSLFKEIDTLTKLLNQPKHPFVIILGGAKVVDKIKVIKNLLKKADYILLGGVMANIFLYTRNVDIKKSVIDKEAVEEAERLIRKSPKKFILPMDLIWNKDRIVDIGPITIGYYQKYIAKAKEVFWNGTMGLTSLGMDKFAKGTYKIVQAMAESKAKTIISGGDTISEVNKLKLGDKMDFVSSGGGSTLEFLAGNKLPGLEVLE